ncbi:MAG: Hsp70 family protein [Verrucomicrobiales bacterium]
MAVSHVGIDLGTTTSGLAYIRSDGNPEIVPNADGERLTPSVVYFDSHEDVKLVGTAARDGGDPDRTVQLIKRHMDDPSFVVTMDGRAWTPTEISALILAKLKRDCERSIGPIEECVLTVPANFNELARRATIAAGQIAGFRVRRIVNEPTAAALYYAHAHSVQGRIVIYDLGGGTLDITILEIESDDVRILTSEGARRLGGSNFDEALLDLMADEYRRQHRAELYENERQRRQALQTGEDLKKMLSKLRNVANTIGNERLGLARIEITRDVFEQAMSRLFTRTHMLVEQALESVDLQPSDIEHVCLVGGGTRMPRIREMLRGLFGREPLACGNVDECVPLGAALFSQKAARVREVCNHSYGTLALIEDAATGRITYENSIVIPKNTPIPCEQSQTYVTSENDERVIEVAVTQGEDTDPAYVDVIGKIQLAVPPGRPAGCEVTVTYSYDANQRVHAHVVDGRSGLSQEVHVAYEGAGVLSEDRIAQRAAEFKSLKIE